MDQEFTVQMVIEFLIIFVSNFAGSYTNDFLTIIQKKNCGIRYNKVLISAFGMAILSWAGSEIALAHMSSKLYIGLNFLLGLMSYSIITQLNSIEGLIKFIMKCMKVLKAFYEFTNMQDKQDKKDKKE